MGYLISSFGRVLDFESVQFLIGLNWLFLHFPSFPFKNITCLNKHLEYCTGIYQSTKIFAFTGILGIYIRLNYFKCFEPLRTIKKHTVQFKVIPFMFFFSDKDLYSPTLLRDILNEVCCEEGTLLHLSSKVCNSDVLHFFLKDYYY